MIKQVGHTIINPIHQASCHCGAVQWEVSLPDGLQDLSRCNCSFCRRKGAIIAAVGLSDIHIIQGEDKLTLYQFNTKTAKHYFCSVCGIYTHHQKRSNPEQYGFNIGCLQNVDPHDLQHEDIRIFDGANHLFEQI